MVIHARTASAAFLASTSFSGTATTSAVYKRSIIDITKPGGEPNAFARGGPQSLECQVICSTYKVYLSIAPGTTGLQAARQWRDGVNTNPQMVSDGYHATMVDSTPTNGTVALVRNLSYSITDSGSLGGIVLSQYGPVQGPGLGGAGRMALALGLLMLGGAWIRFSSPKV